MPVHLEIPVRVGGEPVVLVAVEDDSRVGADPALPEELLELGLLDDVALDRILQVVLPVQLDRAGDVALVVEVGVLVDLGDADAVVVQVLCQPVGADEHVIGISVRAHGVLHFFNC